MSPIKLTVTLNLPGLQVQTDEPELALFTQQKDDNLYLLLMATPPKDEVFKVSSRPRELIFIIDSSGSMSGTSMAQAKEALIKALGRLEGYRSI